MLDPAHSVELAPPSSHPEPSRRRVDAVAHWLVIRNPAAGRARRQRHAWRSFERALLRAGVTFDVQSTRQPGDAGHLAESAAAKGQSRILVAGGDGTVHEVLNGLMRASAPATKSAQTPTLVPIPLGTGNDWARSLRLPRRPDELAALVASAPAVAHDVGMITFAERNRPCCWFVNVAGAGFDAHVLQRLPGATPSRVAYLAGALRELGRYAAPKFYIECDGRSVAEGRRLLAFVAIGRYCGRGMHVAPCAELDDGRFEVVSIADLRVLRALPKLFALYTRGVLRDPLVRHTTATRVRIDSEPAVGVEADGQVVGTTPATFTVAPRALLTLRGP